MDTAHDLRHGKSMSDDIPFNKVFPLPAGESQQVTPMIRRIVAPNPGPFTFTGTVTYIIGQGDVVVLDPGPDDQSHVDAILNAVRGESVSHIVVTHTHRDHSPAARLLRQTTGAPILGCGPHRPARPLFIGEIPTLDAANDTAYAPDQELNDGDLLETKSFTLETIATPGHTANHLAFALRGHNALFSGDHVMAWSTSIVAPPDGAMSDYMRSLRKLKARSETTYFPGHGPELHDAPRFVTRYINHREAREQAILRKLSKGRTDIPGLVRAIYIGLDPRLFGAAQLSVLAHLEDLVARGVVETEGPPAITGIYRLAGG